MLFFSISSVSSQSLNGFDDIGDVEDNKVLKSNALSSGSSTKSTALSTASKAKTGAKATNASKTSTTKSTGKANTTASSAKKANTTTVNKKTLAKASSSFMNYVDKNGKFPKVKISNKNYSDTEYLYLISKSVENDSNSKIEIKSNLVKPYNNTKIKSAKGTLNKQEYIQIASKTRKFIEKNKRAPNWASSSKGNIPYNQLILTFSKCLDSYNKNNKLPNSIKLDDLDLDKIKSKLNQNSAKSSTNGSAKNSAKTTTNSSIKKNATKTTNSSAKNATKSTTKTTNKTTTAKKANTTASTAKKTNATKGTKANTSGNNSNGNSSLVEKSLNYVNNILNSILDKLDPSKFQIDITQSEEAKGNLNTSKINVDVSGKSSLNVKISAKDTKNTTKSTSAKKANTTNSKKKTASTKKATKKTVSKTKDISKAIKEYLISTKNCQVNDKQIKELAKKLTSSLKTDLEKGKKLFAWVRDNIQYERYSNTRRGAVKTLQSKMGNCVDQSHLLIALSRAAGIPARYVNGGNCKFTSGYVAGHVWTQLYINNKWVVADTTSSRNSLGKIKNWNTKSYTLYGQYSSINF